MGALDFNVESFDGSRPIGWRWVNHFTNKSELKTMRKMERMSAAYSDVLFRVVQTPARAKWQDAPHLIAYCVAEKPVTPALAVELIQHEVNRYKSGSLTYMHIYQWESPSRGWRIQTAKTKDGELITIGNRATLEHYQRNSFKVGLYQAIVGLNSIGEDSNIYLLNGREIDADSSRSYIHEHSQAAKARARWIMPDGGIAGLHFLAQAIQGEQLTRVAAFYGLLCVDLDKIIEQGNLSDYQRHTLTQVKLLTRTALETLTPASIGTEDITE